MTDLASFLKKHHVRLTNPRKAVFNALKQHKGYMLISDIIKACPETDRVSIYRTLELFSSIGVVQILHIGFKKGYELAEPFKEHHHHIHCKICHKLTSIQSDQLEKTIQSIAKNHEYELSSHHIELWGICKLCNS